MIQDVATNTNITQVAQVVGLLSAVILLAGNILFAGIFVGRITSLLKSQTKTAEQHAAEMERMMSILLNHESRISNIEGSKRAVG